MAKLYQYKAKILSVYDGDTCTALVDLGFNTFRKIKIRLAGINTPELKSKDLRERLKAKAARNRLKELVLGKDVYIVSHGKGKYGRWLCDMYLQDGTHVNKLLLKEGYAVKYP